MEKLIIIGNPKEKSFSHAIAEALENSFKKKNIKLEILDLSRIKEFKFIDLINIDYIKQIQAKILNTKEIIFIHPLYWITMPAILKNFF